MLKKQRNLTEKCKKSFIGWKLPHTYVILTIILLVVVGLTYIIPGGEYDRVIDPANGKTIVLPDSFHFVEGNRPGFFDIFLSVSRGYVSAADILFLIVFAYGFVYVLKDNGTLDAAVSALLKLMGKRTELLIPVGMLLFGLLGSTLGIFEETYGLVPLFASIMLALGYDNLVGGAVVYIGVATGFAAAMTNPFSVGIAQTIADVPLNSGVAYRAVIFAVFEMVSIWYVMRYARKVKQNPERSVLYGCDEMERSDKKQYDKEVNFTFRRKLCTILFFATIGILLYGTSMLGWYIDEISSLFLAMMVVAGVVGGSSLNEICLTFIESTKSVVSSILVIGFTRGILIVMKEALISDTIVYYLSSLLDIGNPVISAIGMLFLQSIINIFINGSSSQATITMPIMAPVADIVGVSRQTAVLAYCFGDGFSDMFWPTNCSLECGLMGIPLERWYKFITPLFLIMTILQVFFIALSVYVY